MQAALRFLQIVHARAPFGGANLTFGGADITFFGAPLTFQPA
jgi:hypothetical protein